MNLQMELRRRAKKSKAKILQKFFREKLPFLGVMVPQIREVANKYYQENKERAPSEVYKTVTKLMNGKYHEEKTWLCLFLMFFLSVKNISLGSTTGI